MLTVAAASFQITKKNQPASENRKSLIMIQLLRGARLTESSSHRRCELSVCDRELTDGLLLWRSRGFLIHVLLHARFVLGLHLLKLGFLVRSQQLVHFVVDASLLHSEGGLNLGLLCG